MIRIDRHSDRNKNTFKKLWSTWLETATGHALEGKDLEEISNPKLHYDQKGGAAFYAMQDDFCVGIVAVKKLSADKYEFCKLLVTNQARGKGIGRKLIEACIDFARSEGGKHLYLQSLHQLKPALHLYTQLEFEDCDAPDGMFVYERTEVLLRKKLTP